MKLYGSTTSPYVRNVRLVAAHHGLDEAMEFIPVSTVRDRAALQARNPLGKIPVLQTDEGELVYDSAVICDYLDNLGDGPSLFVTEHMAPWRIKTLLALSNGVLDAVVARTMMLLRTPEPEDQSAWWLQHWAENAEVAVAAMADSLAELRDSQSMAWISFPVTLDYVSFRMPDFDWRSKHPDLAAWTDEHLQTDRFRESDPRL